MDSFTIFPHAIIQKGTISVFYENINVSIIVLLFVGCSAFLCFDASAYVTFGMASFVWHRKHFDSWIINAQIWTVIEQEPLKLKFEWV